MFFEKSMENDIVLVRRVHLLAVPLTLKPLNSDLFFVVVDKHSVVQPPTEEKKKIRMSK